MTFHARWGQPGSRSLIVVGVAVALVTTACGGSNPPSSDAAAGASAPGSSSSATTDGLSAASALVTKYENAPTSVNAPSPLKTKVPDGSYLVELIGVTPVDQIFARYAKEAATLLGVNIKQIPVSTAADGTQAALQSALALNPAPQAIIVPGVPKSTFVNLLAKAKAKNIPIIEDSSSDEAGTGDGIVAVINGPENYQVEGKVMAAKVAVDSGGKAQVALFNIPSFPVLNGFVEGFKAGLKEYCPSGCSVTEVPQLVTDIGRKTPGSVVNTFQRNSKLGYAIFTFGDLSTGVSAALASAGLSSRVKIGGNSPSAANMGELKAGKDLAWIGLPAPIVGYRLVDAFTRIVTKDDAGLTADTTNPMPNQILTPSNIGSAVLDKDGNFNGVSDYQAQFQKVWGLS